MGGIPAQRKETECSLQVASRTCLKRAVSTTRKEIESWLQGSGKSRGGQIMPNLQVSVVLVAHAV
jgi:hypothetical protein